MTHGRARPERVFGPVSGTVFLLFAWEAVAHASGSGWVQGIGAVVAGIALIGMIGPRFAVRRVKLTVTSAPADARRGEPFSLTVVSSRPCRCAPIRPRGAEVMVEPSTSHEVVVTPDHRGVLEAVAVRVGSAAPFGLLWWSERRVLTLPRAVVIAPVADPSARRRAGIDGATSDEDEDEKAASAPAVADRGELRSVREYRLGDSPQQVHWRASAHTGSLMVRESERQADQPLRVVADLPDDADAAEELATKVMTTVALALGARSRVLLETSEGGRRITAEVPNLATAGRRLARAGRNPWADLAP